MFQLGAKQQSKGHHILPILDLFDPQCPQVGTAYMFVDGLNGPDRAVGTLPSPSARLA